MTTQALDSLTLCFRCSSRVQGRVAALNSNALPKGDILRSNRYKRRYIVNASSREAFKVTAHRGPKHASPAASRSTSFATSSTEFEVLKGLSVTRAKNGDNVPLVAGYMQNYGPGHICLLPFITHFADLSSWEYAKKLKPLIPQLEAAGVQVIVVGLGDRQNAMLFSKLLDFPLRLLYADPEGLCYKALGFQPGFAPEANLSPYLKLLVMLAGIGSPGTIQEVARGYLGDRSGKPVWPGSNAFDVLGKGYQRPFELATLRLFNMANVLPRWNKLGPRKTSLLTQQGGTLLFRDTETVLRQDDTGILKYAQLPDFVAAINNLKSSSIEWQSQL